MFILSLDVYVHSLFLLSKNQIFSLTVTHLLETLQLQTIWSDAVYEENEQDFSFPLQYSIELAWQQDFSAAKSQNLCEQNCMAQYP